MYEISKVAMENRERFEKIVGVDRNFDIVEKNVSMEDKKIVLFTINGFTKDDMIEKILEYLMGLSAEDYNASLQEFLGKIPFAQTGTAESLEMAARQLLKGLTCMFVDGYDKSILLDCRQYPQRSVSEPWKNRVLRGSRDGFVENLVSNVALIRRRIRTTDFSVEILDAGYMSKTDIALAYIKGKADEKLVRDLKERIKNIKVEALTMNIESVAEVLLKGAYINPFPKFKYSERPDSTAAALYDGNIAIIIDNSPAVLIVPVCVFDVVEEADDYYFPPVTGTYIKISRYAMSFLSLIITPLWVAFLNEPQYVPQWLEFIIPDKAGQTVPVILQLLILEFSIDGLRLAAVSTPNLLSTPLSVIAGIVVGEYAVKSGWFDGESLLYMAFVSIGTYTQASFELGYTIKFFRMITLVLSWFLGFWGFGLGVLSFLACAAFNHTISGKSYIYPLIPFNGKMLARKMIRLRLGKEK